MRFAIYIALIVCPGILAFGLADYCEFPGFYAAVLGVLTMAIMAQSLGPYREYDNDEER